MGPDRGPGVIPGVVASARTSGAWTPASVASLELWQDASDASTLTVDGSNRVSEWRDKSGNGWHGVQATDGQKPLAGVSINGVPALNFSNKTLDNASFSQSQPFSFGAVYKLTQTIAQNGVNFANFRVGMVANGKFSLWQRYVAALEGPAVDMNAHVFTGVANGGSSYMDTSGLARVSGVLPPNPTGAVQYGAGGMYGYLGEVVIFSEVFNPQVMTKLSDYLKAKWGIA